MVSPAKEVIANKRYSAGRLIAVQLFRELFPQRGELDTDGILGTELRSLPPEERARYTDLYLMILEKAMPLNTNLPRPSKSLLETNMTVGGLASYTQEQFERYNTEVPAFGKLTRYDPWPQYTRPLSKKDWERIKAVERLEAIGRRLTMSKRVIGLTQVPHRVVMPEQETRILEELAKSGPERAYEPRVVRSAHYPFSAGVIDG